MFLFRTLLALSVAAFANFGIAQGDRSKKLNLPLKFVAIHIESCDDAEAQVMRLLGQCSQKPKVLFANAGKRDLSSVPTVRSYPDLRILQKILKSCRFR